MAIPTQFSVAKTRKCPLANPAQPIDGANPLTAEDVCFISGASVLPAEAAGGIGAPSELTAQPVDSIDNASLFSALSVGNIDNPSIVTAESVAPVDSASLIGAESEAVIYTPTPFTAKAGTLTTPPFPLNHARMLSSNKLEGYSSVSSDVGGVALNALKMNTWEKWRPPAPGYFKVVLNSAQQVDTIGIGAHNMGSRGFAISPQYREIEGGPLLQFAGAKSPTTDAAIMFHRPTPVTMRVLEIYVSGGTNGEIGYISAGLALQMQRPMFNGHQPYTDSDVTEYYSNRTESGEIIGRQVRRKGYETTYEWQNIDDGWYRTYFAPFKEAIKTRPFFVAWNLLEYPNDVAFGETTGDISTSMQNGTRTKRNGLSFNFKRV